MKIFRFIAVLAFLTAIFTVSGIAQTAPNVKIAMINTQAFFDEKAGISELINAGKKLQAEFEPRAKEIEALEAKLQTIANELETMQKKAADPATRNVVDPATFTAKQEEGQRLQREYEFKGKELNAAIERRRQALFDPIRKNIGIAIDEFAKKNGFTMIIDVSKMDDNGSLLFFSETADSTRDFITFFNARGPGTPTPPSGKPGTISTRPN